MGFKKRLNENIQLEVDNLRYLLDRYRNLSFLQKMYYHKIEEGYQKKKEDRIDPIIKIYNCALEETISFSKKSLLNKLKMLNYKILK